MCELVCFHVAQVRVRHPLGVVTNHYVEVVTVW